MPSPDEGHNRNVSGGPGRIFGQEGEVGIHTKLAQVSKFYQGFVEVDLEFRLARFEQIDDSEAALIKSRLIRPSAGYVSTSIKYTMYLTDGMTYQKHLRMEAISAGRSYQIIR